MNTLKICFPVSDVDFKETLSSHFNNITFYQERTVTAMGIIFVAAIPVVGATVELLDFIMTYFVKRDKPSTESLAPEDIIEEDKKKKRKVEIDKTRVTLYEFTPEEIELLFSDYLVSENE